MHYPRLTVITLLSLVFSTAAFAGHKQPSHHHQAKYQHPAHKLEHRHHKAGHEQSHPEYRHPQSVQVYSDYKVYRTVKHRSAHRHQPRYGYSDGYDDRRRLAYGTEWRDTYRLIAGAIVLNEVFHHVHH